MGNHASHHDSDTSPYLQVGNIISLIRWRQTRDGDWYHELARGQYRGRTPAEWVVSSGGRIRNYPRDTWSYYR